MGAVRTGDFPLNQLTSPAPLFVRLEVGAVGPVLPVPETKGLHAEPLGGGQSDSWTDTREPEMPHKKGKVMSLVCLVTLRQ